MFNEKLYIPRAAVIQKIEKLTYDTKLFKLKFKDGGGNSENNYKPGQFVQVSMLGTGEAPISICSSPTQDNGFELCVRNAGLVTSMLHNFKSSDELGIRGPYGNGFNIEEFKGQNLIFIGGGIGLAPLRSAINYVMDNRNNFGKMIILYGARTKEDIVFADDLNRWERQQTAEVFTTIDNPQKDWAGHTGVVTTLFNNIRGKSGHKVFVCGPPIMIHFAVKELLDMGWGKENIIMTLERHMKCGVGKCGHCYLEGKYVCTDGPVFTCAQIDALNIEI